MILHHSLLDVPGTRTARDRVLAAVEERLRVFLAAERAQWSTVDDRAAVPVAAVEALAAAGGKRLRPAFCVTGFLAAGGDPADARVVEAGAALELLHTSALIHDDVLDASPLRRGRPTAHAHYAKVHAEAGWSGSADRFGENVAILAGDLALVYAERLMRGAGDRVVEEWEHLRAELMVGQYLDVAVAAERVADPELSRWVAVCKSGRYSIHRPLVLGATAAGRPELASAFQEYGQALGEAFQLRDDLIGAFGDSETSGKPTSLDLEQQKMTLLLALAVDRDERVRAHVADGVSADNAQAQGEALRALLLAAGVDAEVERRIDALVATAARAVEAAPIAPAWQRELTVMAGEVAYRDA